MHRAGLIEILNVANLENKLSWQLGVGEKYGASGSDSPAALLNGHFERPAGVSVALTHERTIEIAFCYLEARGKLSLLAWPRP
jgi:hypothetical protein